MLAALLPYRSVSSAKVALHFMQVVLPLREVADATFDDGPPLAPERGKVLLVDQRLQEGLSRIKGIPPFLLANMIPIAIAITPLPLNSQNRNSRTSLVRREKVPKLVQFWDPFLRGFGPQNGPQNCSKM